MIHTREHTEMLAENGLQMTVEEQDKHFVQWFKDKVKHDVPLCYYLVEYLNYFTKGIILTFLKKTLAGYTIVQRRKLY